MRFKQKGNSAVPALIAVNRPNRERSQRDCIEARAASVKVWSQRGRQKSSLDILIEFDMVRLAA